MSVIVLIMSSLAGGKLVNAILKLYHIPVKK